MSLFTRKDSPFWYFWLEGTKIRENTKILVDAPTEAERKENKRLAQQAYNARMGDLARDRYELPTAKNAMTFGAFAGWYRDHALPHHRGAEREREILPRLITAFGKFDLRQLTRRIVDEWVTMRLKEKRTVNGRTFGPPSASTVNRELDLLKTILQAAVPSHLDASPLYGMKRLRTVTPKRRLMTEAEETKLMKALAVDDQAIVLIGLDALVRLGDILDLRRSDDHGAALWIADPKAGGGFHVPVSSRVRKALDALYVKRTIEADEYLFKRRRIAKTDRDKRNGIRQMLERACEAANIPYGRAKDGLTFHWATRRTGATRMLTRGSDPGTVQKVGRWKRPDVVLGIYHELIDSAAQRAVESVGNGREHSGSSDRPKATKTDSKASNRKRLQKGKRN